MVPSVGLKLKSCCFTGHRPEKMGAAAHQLPDTASPLRMHLRAAVERAYEDGYRHFICGMARGCDMAFALEVLALREREEGVRLEAAVPCLTQADRWSLAEKEQYERILRRCDMVSIISRDYTSNCMMDRNRYMTENSRRIIAIYSNRIGGGTGKTIGFARKGNLEMEIIDPTHF